MDGFAIRCLRPLGYRADECDEKWRPAQDSNLQPPTSKAGALIHCASGALREKTLASREGVEPSAFGFGGRCAASCTASCATELDEACGADRRERNERKPRTSRRCGQAHGTPVGAGGSAAMDWLLARCSRRSFCCAGALVGHVLVWVAGFDPAASCFQSRPSRAC